MNKLHFFIFAGFLLVSCKGDNEPSHNTQENQDLTIHEEATDLTDEKTSDRYQEFHPNGQLKIDGRLNENGERTGLWMSFYENGVKWSESYYTDGKKDGHSLTFFPNGQVRYIGEYKADQKVGTWKFYDEEGNLISEENF